MLPSSICYTKFTRVTDVVRRRCVMAKARKISDKELVRSLFSKQVRKALKKMVAAAGSRSRPKGRKNKKKR